MNTLILLAAFPTLTWSDLGKMTREQICAAENAYLAGTNEVRISVYAIEEESRRPIADLKVGAYFTIDTLDLYESRYAKSESVTSTTDSNGWCRLTGHTNTGSVNVMMERPAPEGYYWTLASAANICTNRNAQGEWLPENAIATVVVQRVGHPIPLRVKLAELNFPAGGPFDAGRTVSYDLFDGDLLPPLGKGRHADIVLTCLPREDYGMRDKNFPNLHSFTDRVSVRFVGDGNGQTPFAYPKAGPVAIRTAPETGYVPETFAVQRMDDELEFDSGYRDNKHAAFRIRTERDKDGKIVSAYYGKFSGNFEPMQGKNHVISGIRFQYYLNPTPLDRYLEWDCKANLFPNASRVRRDP